MLPLRELQARFLRSIATTPERSDGHGFDPALLELVEGRGRLGSTDRLGVYTEMYWARLLDVLRDDFPRVAAVLGGDRFTALAGAYLERHPSTDPSVRWVGAYFAAFLAERGRVDEQPFLTDLARLEWRGERLAPFFINLRRISTAQSQGRDLARRTVHSRGNANVMASTAAIDNIFK